ncbi:MAG: hypothetical protein ABSC42_16305 [Tepidisphaeraceae bacterium]|jgi:hypothetical protein
MGAQRTTVEDRGNLQVIVVNLNGNNLTIQDALRTVDSMIRRHGAENRDMPLVTGKGKSKAISNGKEKAETQVDEEPRLFVDPAKDDPDSADITSQNERPVGGQKRGRPRVSGIPDLDFNSATPTFREFAEEKKPRDLFDWYLLVASWMKSHKQVEEIGIAHVITANQYIGSEWSLPPDDVGRPFRDGRRREYGYFIKGSKNGMSKITKIGEDRVARMNTVGEAR